MCYFILTEKCKVLARTNVKNSKKNEAAKDNFQISIVHYHKCLDGAFGRVNHYALNLYGLEGLANNDVPKTCSIPRRTFFLHALSFESTSKLCITFLNKFSVYFDIQKMHNTS